MALWEALLAYALILVWAALLGWLPFRLLEYISIVDQLKPMTASHVTSSWVACLACGQANERGYDYCEFCGAKLPTTD